MVVVEVHLRVVCALALLTRSAVCFREAPAKDVKELLRVVDIQGVGTRIIATYNWSVNGDYRTAGNSASRNTDFEAVPGGPAERSGGWVPADNGWIASSDESLERSARGDEFQCPEECAECCTRRRKARTTHFACLLRNQLPLPADGIPVKTRLGTLFLPRERKCGPAYDSNDKVIQQNQNLSSLSLYQKIKTKRGFFRGVVSQCEFTENEKKDESWKDLRRCSGRYNCCCSGKDYWTEDICMPKQAAKQVWMKSKQSKKVELFNRRPAIAQTFENRHSACRSSTLSPMHYDIPAIAEDKNIKDSCCTETQSETKCDEHDHCVTSQRCIEWEKLYHCSGDKGVTQEAFLYKRTAATPGTCISDQSQRSQLLQLNVRISATFNQTLRRIIPEIMGGQNRPYLLGGGTCPVSSFSIGADGRPCQCKSSLATCRTGSVPHDKKNEVAMASIGGVALAVAGAVVAGPAGAAAGYAAMAAAAAAGGYTGSYLGSSVAKDGNAKRYTTLQRAAKNARANSEKGYYDSRGKTGALGRREMRPVSDPFGKRCWIVMYKWPWSVKTATGESFGTLADARLFYHSKSSLMSKVLFDPFGIETLAQGSVGRWSSVHRLSWDYATSLIPCPISISALKKSGRKQKE